jgi:FkbM family methyltransferase
MQIVNGICLPDRDTHFVNHIRDSETVDGKGTYQLSKIMAGIDVCKSRRLAIDVGANAGLWSRILAKYFYQVAAIEPMPENIECLKYNLEHCQNVEIFPVAVSSHFGILSLKYVKNISTALVCNPEDEGSMSLPCQSLDDFGFKNVDFIKVDVEGYENNIIKSGERTIRENRPVIVVEQKKRTLRYDNYKFEAISTLSKWGMDIAWDMAGDFCLVWR